MSIFDLIESPTPPEANVWDVETIADAALERLRMQSTDADADRVTAAAVVATYLLDAELDVPVTDPPSPLVAATLPLLIDAAVELTVEVYQRKDAQFDGVVGIDPIDAVASVRAQVRSQKRRWGIA